MTSEKQGRRVQDPDAEPDAPVVPGDRRNGNGKKWWQEVWSKVTAGLLLLILSGALLGAWGKTLDAIAATSEVLALPPVVQRHEVEIRALAARPVPSPMDTKALAKEIAAELRKGRQ